jgi:hypothetical protein
MSLYGDLPQAKDSGGAGGGAGNLNPNWAGSAKKLQPTLRKPSLAPPAVLRTGRGAGRAGPVPLGRGAGRGPPPARQHDAEAGVFPPGAPASGSLLATITAQPVQHPLPLAPGAGSSSPVGKLPAGAGAAAAVAAGPISSNLFAVDGHALEDEYDPAKPNDYEEIVRCDILGPPLEANCAALCAYPSACCGL